MEEIDALKDKFALRRCSVERKPVLCKTSPSSPTSHTRNQDIQTHISMGNTTRPWEIGGETIKRDMRELSLHHPGLSNKKK